MKKEKRIQETINIFNRGKREFEIRTGRGDEIKILAPQSGMDVSQKIGQRLIRDYPREIVDSDKMTGGSGVNKKAAEIAAREKALAEKEKALADREAEIDALMEKKAKNPQEHQE